MSLKMIQQMIIAEIQDNEPGQNGSVDDFQDLAQR